MLLILGKTLKEEESEHQIYLPDQAVKYLREERGIIMSVASLRQRRKRMLEKGQAMQDPNRVFKRTSIWTKAELDAIKVSWKTKQVEPQVEDNGEA